MKKLKNKKEIKKWLDKYKIKNFIINDDLSVDVNGNVDLSGNLLACLPLKFRNISKSFWCHDNQLETFDGMPENVGGVFYCNDNNVKSFKDAPKSIGGDFYCGKNKIESLAGLNFCEFKAVCFDIDWLKFREKKIGDDDLFDRLKKYEIFNLLDHHFAKQTCIVESKKMKNENLGLDVCSYQLSYNDFCCSVKPILDRIELDVLIDNKKIENINKPNFI